MEKNYPFNLITEYVIEGYGITNQISYEIEEIAARDLLTPWRIDLMAKWIYIDAKVNGWDMSYATKLYKNHLDSFSNGRFYEPGNTKKSSLEQYIQVFDELIRDFQKTGFDEKKSLLPVGENNVLLDGAHRCACAAYFNQRVKIIRFKNIKQNFGYDFFLQRFLDRKSLDRMVLEYCSHNKKLFMACLWPAAKGNCLRNKAEEIIGARGQIVYKREIKLNYRGLKNFITQIYAHQSWIGSFREHYAGAEAKCRACYRRNEKIRVILFQCSSLETVVKMKEDIRDIFGIENHSVHISDNAKETREMAELLLNPNSIFHLNYGRPERFEGINGSMEKWKHLLKETGEINTFDYVLDWRRSQAVFGVKDCMTIGGVSLGRMPQILRANWIESERTERNLKEMLQDTDNYFKYQGIKFETIVGWPIENIRGLELSLLRIVDDIRIYKEEQINYGLKKKIKKIEELQVQSRNFRYQLLRNILKHLGIYEWLKSKLY